MALCFVPMVAFDPDGFRLGQGKGYYDRFLEKFQGHKVGVGFSWQEAAGHIPVEPHDQPLETIVTERGIRQFQNP
jgi:5-formyltetrahydrofolate cyclo-ligase